jgi:hypothetical protein
MLRPLAPHSGLMMARPTAEMKLWTSSSFRVIKDRGLISAGNSSRYAFVPARMSTVGSLTTATSWASSSRPNTAPTLAAHDRSCRPRSSRFRRKTASSSSRRMRSAGLSFTRSMKAVSVSDFRAEPGRAWAPIAPSGSPILKSPKPTYQTSWPISAAAFASRVVAYSSSPSIIDQERNPHAATSISSRSAALMPSRKRSSRSSAPAADNQRGRAHGGSSTPC